MWISCVSMLQRILAEGAHPLIGQHLRGMIEAVIGVSSNGRTTDSGSVSWGSSPCTPARNKKTAATNLAAVFHWITVVFRRQRVTGDFRSTMVSTQLPPPRAGHLIEP